MRHAVLGAGGVGGFVGAVLAHGGQPVTLLLRPATLAVHPDTLTLESGFGPVTAPVSRAASLDTDVDVLWVATKATQLEAALAAVPGPARPRMVVPLLNGIDHVERLRARFGTAVLPATIACECERTAPGWIAHRSPFARLAFLAADEDRIRPAADLLRGFGCDVAFLADEATLLWRKLVFLAPIALTTSAAGMTVGGVRDDPAWRERLDAAAREGCAVAVASGAAVDAALTLSTLASTPGNLRSSMSKDVAAGRPPELDAIAGPILRGGRRFGIPVPVTEQLAGMIRS
jgi:2-dehydropantoate 2-reductase